MADFSGPPPALDPDHARRSLEEGDSAWERRYEPGGLEAARRAYFEAAAADPSLYDAYWKAARSSNAIGERAASPEARADAFRRGVGAARLGIERQPDRAEAHYLYALSLGLHARERPSTGVESVKEMVPHLDQAAQADPDFDFAGPHRALALVYLRAPGWPVSVGDEAAGLTEARTAVERAPEYPPNHLALAEALAANGMPDEARDAVRQAIALAGSGPWTDEERRGFRDEADRLSRDLPGGR